MKKNEEVVVKRKKFKFAKFLLVILFIYIFVFYIYKLVSAPINNIYIENNKYLTDQEVIDLSGISNYPSFVFTTKYSVKNKLLRNDLIKSVIVKKSFGRTITINIVEEDILFLYGDGVVLSNGRLINNNDYKLPILYGDNLGEVFNKLVEKYINVNDEIKLMISEIKYDPNNIDKERFLITMNDGNYVYITLYKIAAINEYIKILSNSNLDGKKGIFYLDSGNYFEEFKKQ